MSITGAGDQMKSDWPHRRCALWEPFLVTEVRWFMIYFPINPSLLCALGPPVNKCQARLSPYTFPPTSTVEASPALPSSVKPNWEGPPHLLIHLICTRACLLIGTRERMEARLKSHEWQSSSGVGFGRRLAGSAHLGLQADGEGWGLHNTRLSHMSTNHTEPLGSP